MRCSGYIHEIASEYVGLSTTERLNLAYDALAADGFTWTVDAERDEDGNILEESRAERQTRVLGETGRCVERGSPGP